MTVDILGVSGPVSASGVKLGRDQGAVIRAFRDALVRALKENAPINKDPAAKTRGGLRTSIVGNLTGNEVDGYALEFSANAYVQYVLAGTRPHIITPSNKRALAFQWNTATVGGHGFTGRGPRGGFLRSTPFGRLPLKYVQLGGSMNMAAGRKNLSRGTPRFGGIQLIAPKYNKVGRMIQGPLMGHVQPVNVKGNMDKGSPNSGNVVLRMVHHPGTQPNDFFGAAIAQVTPEIDALADSLGDAVADRIVGIMMGARI